MLGAVLHEVKRVLAPYEGPVMEQRVKRTQYLHVGVEIYTSVTIHGIETHEVGGKGPFAFGYGLAHEYIVDVGDALHVPFHYGVVRHMLTP